jgi:spore germination protein
MLRQFDEFSYYRFNTEGELENVDDEEIIQLAKAYGVAPMMLISSLTEQGVGSSDVAHNVLNNLEVQDHLFANVLAMLRRKGYYGLNIYLQFLTEQNRTTYEAFIERFSTLLHNEG